MAFITYCVYQPGYYLFAIVNAIMYLTAPLYTKLRYMSHHLLNYAPFRIYNKFPRKSNFQAYLTYLEQTRIIIILLILFHSSDIRVLCLLKISSEMLQYLPQTRNISLGVFFFVLNFMPNTLSNSLFCWNISSSTNFNFLKSNLLKLGRFYTNVLTLCQRPPNWCIFLHRDFFKKNYIKINLPFWNLSK